VRGKHISFTRGKRNSSPSTSLIKIEGCDSINDAEFYLGKRIAYVYRVRSPPYYAVYLCSMLTD
jgi:large subunit ribosomal protein L35Ae